MYIGTKLKDIRQKAGLNQSEIALMINVSQSYYSSLESSKKPISKACSKIINEVFGVDLLANEVTPALAEINLLEGITPPNMLIEAIAALEMMAMQCRRVAYETHSLDNDAIDNVLMWYAESDVLNKGAKATLHMGGSGANYVLTYPNTYKP